MAIKVANNNSLSAITSLPAAVSGGAMTLLETQTASSSSTISFTSNIDSTYKEYVFKFINIHPQTGSQSFSFQGSTNTGSSYGVTTTSTLFRGYHNEGDTATGVAYRGDYDVAQGTGFIPLSDGVALGNENDECWTRRLY